MRAGIVSVVFVRPLRRLLQLASGDWQQAVGACAAGEDNATDHRSKLQRNFPALPHVAAQNGIDRVSVGLRMAIGGKTGNKRRAFGAVCRNQETIPDCQA